MSDAASVPEASSRRAPAPGELELVRAFVNTIDIENDDDHFRDPSVAARWLAKRKLVARGETLSAADVRLLVRLREAIRELARANHGDLPDRRATSALNEIAAGARLSVRFERGGKAKLDSALPGVDGAIGRLLAILSTAMTDGSWSRFKACQADDCRWAFYDRSKNRSSRWCRMAICGNRAKVRTYRRRKRSEA